MKQDICTFHTDGRCLKDVSFGVQRQVRTAWAITAIAVAIAGCAILTAVALTAVYGHLVVTTTCR